MRDFVAIKIFLIVIFLLFGCDDGYSHSELSSQYQSPDNMNVLSIVTFNYGATVPFVFRVFINSKNVGPLNIDKDLDVLRIDSNEALKITWNDNDTVSIRCVRGSIYKYTSIGQIGDHRVRVNLNTNC